MELMEHQRDVLPKLDSGKILYGDVGAGKSRTAVAYYMEKEAPKDVIVITTAKKRDSLDWEGEFARVGVGTSRAATLAGYLRVDSWNNIGNYTNVRDCFFIFDEQRLVGSGVWVKTFLKIAQHNRWIMLSATPGDNWLDYAPVFIANGFYKNITDFKLKHVLYEPFSKFPKVRGYLNQTKLEILRNDILVEMPYLKDTERVLNWMAVGYDENLYRRIYKDRWNPYEEKPIKDVAELFRLMRRAVNTDPSRMDMVRDLMKLHPRLIIWYNFNYELEILRELGNERPIGEWNGHRKNPIPDTDEWIYLVQYVAGAEGWNCISTDAMIMYSLTYSYKNFEQAQGRIDRLNTTFRTLYYYILVSNSMIDRSIKQSLDNKESFNERRYLSDPDNFREFEERYEVDLTKMTRQ